MRMRAELSRRNSGDSRSDPACSFEVHNLFQSLGAQSGSEHPGPVLDPDHFSRESARIHRWSITAASRRAPRRARTKANTRKVSLGHVLAHHTRHLEHVNLRHRQDLLQLRVWGDNAPRVQLVFLDVTPESLDGSRPSHLLPAADRRQIGTQVHRSEETNALLLRGGRGLLAARLAVLLD